MPSVQLRDFVLSFVDEGAGPALLLVHGFPLDRRMWTRQVAALRDRFRVIAPDLRGCGASRYPAARVTTMAQLAGDLVQLLDQLGIVQVTFCGLSMGGYVAWEFCRRYSERVAKLILCDTRAAADTPDAAQKRLATADRVLAEGPGFLYDEMRTRLLAPDTARHVPDADALVAQMIRQSDSAGIAALSRGMAERADAADLLATIDVPTLVLVGEHDAISPPEEMRSIADRIAGAEFTVIARAGHLSPLENPDTVNAAMAAFL
jgi:pimeloyl-ACP methyl ester carboxylesterase